MSEGLREFIRNLEEAGELLRIKVEVDWNLEIGAITCRIHDKKGPALLFEKIKDVSTGYHLLTAPYGTYRRYALGLGLPKDASASEIIGEYRQRIKYPIKPMLLDKAPCKENIFLDKEADLFRLPLPKWHSRDRGRFLGTLCAVITKDLETDWVNVGMYRMMVHDNYSTGIAIGSWNHGGQIYQKYEKRGEPMPMAVCIGVEPAIHFVAVASFAYGVNELDMAGALKRAPAELVKCETMDLYVPNAEIVVEGEVPPKERKIDYPFGEYTGTYGGDPIDPVPVFRVKAITHRNNPIATGTLEKNPPSDDNLIGSIAQSVLALDELERAGIPVRDVYYLPYGATFHIAVVSAPRTIPGRAMRIAQLLFSCRARADLTNWVIVVDEDIDPTNIEQVFWAIATRCSPERDVQIFRRTTHNPLLPFLPPEQRKQMAGGSKVLVDASWPEEWPQEYIPPIANWEDYSEEVREKALEMLNSVDWMIR